MTVEQRASARQTTSRSFWQRRSVKICTGILVCMIAGVFSMPFAAKFYLQKWLLENGADLAVIEKVRFNPFSGVVGLDGVRVEKNGTTVFSDSTICLNIGMKNLLGHEALLQQATLTDVVIDIERLEDGSLRLGPYGIPPESAGTENLSDDVAVQDGAVQEDDPWILRATSIALQNITLLYKQPDLEVRLVIEEAIVEKVTTDPNDKGGTLTLKGTVNGAPVNLDLSALTVIPIVDVQGKVSFSDFPMDDLADFLSESLTAFSGTAGVDGDIMLSVAENEDLQVTYGGLLQIDKGDVGGESWGDVRGTIAYDGNVLFTMTDDDMVVDVDGDLSASEATFDMPDPMLDIDSRNITIQGKTKVTIADEVIVDSKASLNIAPTTFAMDTLKVSTDEILWDGAVQVETGIETKGLLVRVNGKLKTRKPAYSMDMDGSLMTVDNQKLLYDGSVEYLAGIGDDGQDIVRSNGTIQAETTAFSLPKVIQIHQEGIKLAGKTEVNIGKDIHVSYDGDINSDATTLKRDGMVIGDKKLSWSGKFAYALGETNQIITLDGGITGDEIVADIEDMHFRQKSLKTNTNSVLKLAKSTSFNGTFSVNGKGLEVKKKKTRLMSLAELSMLNSKAKTTDGVFVESVQLNQLVLPSSVDVPVTVTVPNISLTGIESSDFLSAKVKRLSIKSPRVLDAEGKTQLVTFKSFATNNIKISDDLAITAKGGTAKNGVFLKEKDKDALATLTALHLGKLSYSMKEGFVCDSIKMDGLNGKFVREKASDSVETQAEVKEDTTQVVQADKKATTIPVKIKRVSVIGESGFVFIDRSMAKAFQSVLTIESFQANDIDLNKPEQPFTYAFVGALDKYSPVRIEGKCAPLAASFSIEQDVFIQNISMLYVSAYSIEAIGTYFPDGILDYNSQLKVSDGSIDMDNNLFFTDLVIESLEGGLADSLQNQLPVSLDMALSLLRKDDGSIDIDIPISGELSDFHVGVGSIVITALSKAITFAVTPYLAYSALGPAGALAVAGAKVGKAMLDNGLPAVEFESGSSDLNNKQKEALDQSGKKMIADTGSSYGLCAKVSLSELTSASGKDVSNQSLFDDEVMWNELFQLGEKRSITIQEYLHTHFNINEERLLICNPVLQVKSGQNGVVVFKKSAKN